MNKVILIGNVGREPEVRMVGESNKASFSLATSKKIKDDTRTEWHNIVAWGKLAELCGKYVTKGKKLMIEGEINYRSYEDKDKVKKYFTEITMFNMEFLGGKEASEQQDTRSATELYEANGKGYLLARFRYALAGTFVLYGPCQRFGKIEGLLWQGSFS